MKLITTSKNPIFKEGIEFDFDKNGNEISVINHGNLFRCSMLDLQAIWLLKGYIKEVEKKEFTKSDMKSYGTFAGGFIWTQNTNRENIFNEWLKQK